MKIAAIPTTFACLCFSIASHAAELDRTILPVTEPLRVPSTTLDVRNATAPPRFEVKAPEGAPNVLLVLIPDALLHCGQQYAQSGLLRRADAQSRPAFQHKSREFPASGQGISLRISDTLKPRGKTKKPQI